MCLVFDFLNQVSIKNLLTFLDAIWMDSIREEKRRYEKPIILNKNDGSDWRRELL